MFKVNFIVNFEQVNAGWDKINFKIHDITTWETNNCNTLTYCPISEEVNGIKQYNLSR